MPATRLLVTSLAVFLPLLLGGGPAAAAQPACGAEITRDTRLTADLRGCPDNGLVVARDGVTVDLAGHTIAGDGAVREDCPDGDFCDGGVVVAGHERVTVRG